MGSDGEQVVTGRDDLDPQIRLFQRRLSAAWAEYGDLSARPPREVRAIAEAVREPWRRGGPEMFESVERDVAGVRIRIHKPSRAAAQPALIYVHGGGWTIFSIDTHDRLMREYAARAGVVVVGVDYSLSPEAKFPVAADEVQAVVAWLRAGGEPAVDPTAIAIAGDSAGANLALATSLRLRDSGQAPLAGMILNYGAFDTLPQPSYQRYDGEGYMLGRAEMAVFWNNYLNDADRNDPHARVAIADFRSLPPTFLCIAECDILVDENLAIARRLREHDVDVRAEMYKGATHSFLEAVSIADVADRALADASGWLRALFQAGSRHAH